MLRAMAKRRRNRTAVNTPATGDPIPVDLGASVRQVGLVETATGLSHGPTAILVALGAALLLVPARAIWRALTGRSGDRS